MAGYFIANYTITNPDGYQKYLAAVGPTLTAHGAERIVVDRGSDLLEGSAGQALPLTSETYVCFREV